MAATIRLTTLQLYSAQTMQILSNHGARARAPGKRRAEQTCQRCRIWASRLSGSMTGTLGTPMKCFSTPAIRKIGVLVSVSNYFLQPGGGLPDMNKQIPALIQSFSKGGDYHPAIQGIVFGNEFDLPGNGISVANCVTFTNTWVSIEQQQFPNYRKLPIGHPVSFSMQNNRPPCWYAWDQLIPQLSGLNSSAISRPPNLQLRRTICLTTMVLSTGGSTALTISTGCRSGSQKLGRTAPNPITSTS